MSDISPMGTGTTGPISRLSLNGHAGRHSPASEDVATSERPSDRVELSDRARLLLHLEQLPPVRRELVERVKDAIDTGEYPSDDALSIAIERLLEDLND